MGELLVVETVFEGLAPSAGEDPSSAADSPVPPKASASSPPPIHVCRREAESAGGGRVAPEPFSSRDLFVCSDDQTLLFRRVQWEGGVPGTSNGAMSSAG